MSELDKFFQRPESYGERVIGTYLYPYRLFGKPDWDDPYSATKVIAKAKVGTNEVLITCNGGFFLRPPASTESLQDKLAFEEKAANIFNRPICEFALSGIVSAPATPVHISAGRLINGHALITSAAGGRETYPERTIQPSLQLLRGMWRMHPLHTLDVVDKVVNLQCTSLLVEVSDNLPTFVAGAYSLFSQRQAAEALIDSWIVIEQIIDSLWAHYLTRIADNSRKDRLSDPRTYTAAVRIELLYTVGILPLPLYEVLNIARAHRNRLAHRAEISLTMSKECLMAMKEMIEFLCKTSVEPPLTCEGVNW